MTKKITEEHFPDDKDVYITADEQVHHVGDSPPMHQCNHEEADTRILVHLFNALQSSSLGMVHTGDTDVVVILLRNFHHIKAESSYRNLDFLKSKKGNKNDISKHHCHKPGTDSV